VAVTKTASDIIFLSDTRLNSRKQIAGVNDVEKKCRFLGFSIFHNSSLNSRGTAVLLSNKIDYELISIYKDDIGNILLLKIKMNNVYVTIGSIYGPNEDNPEFFETLKQQLKNLNSDYVILGGDWNTTLDCSNSRLNIDTLNMASIPSVRRSNMLNGLCNDCNLVDPFRYFYPETKEFTYVPFVEGAINRSRLDFF
jgi:exonuclease III